MQITAPLGPRKLTGRHVALEPLAEAHRTALEKIAADPSMWHFMTIDGTKEFDRWWKLAEDEASVGKRFSFAVRRVSDGAIVGTTAYLDDMPQHGRVEIGWTWYAREARGTAVNPEAKFLLMQNAFKACGYERVELKTCSTNFHSRAAISKLGAKEEGTLRSHMWMHRGYWRDTVYYSVLKEEWPQVKAGLESRLAALAGTAFLSCAQDV